MRDFRKQRHGSTDIWRFASLILALCIVLAFAVFSVRAAWGMYIKFTVANEANAASKRELANLKTQYASVSAAVEDLSTQRGQEGQIRERFGVAKPGEGAIEIVRTATSTDNSTASEENPVMKFLHALFVW